MSSEAFSSSRVPATFCMRERHRAVGQGGERFDLGTVHSHAASHHQHQGFVLDIVLERKGRPVVVGTPQEQCAVAAVQQVCVSTVFRVDLDERIAVRSVRSIELCSPPSARSSLRSRISRPAPASAATMSEGAGRRLGEPTTTSTSAPTRSARGTREDQFGHAGAPGNGHRTDQREEREIGGPLPRSGEPRFADQRRGGGAGNVRQRREPGRCHPRAARHRARDARMQVERDVEQREDRRACGAGEQQHSEASPASSNDEQDAHDERERHRCDLGQRQDQLAGLDG